MSNEECGVRGFFRRWQAAPVVLLAVVVLTACGVEEPAAEAALPETPLAEEPGLVHVHGLGINPADERLYVATHFGLWRLDDAGSAERVGEHYLDLMGFSIVGPDHFVASGHPPPVIDELPPNLGLIETTDAGETWESAALLGDADFHALRFAHDRIFGWDTVSGELLVSDAGEHWESRSEQAIFDFVVDPADPDRLLATSSATGDELELLRSDDGGATWSEMDAPALARLAWEAEERLFAVDADGQVWQGEDAGAHWEPAGRVEGFPEALLDTGEDLYVAADHRLQLSDDDGSSWQVLLDYGETPASPTAQAPAPTEEPAPATDADATEDAAADIVEVAYRIEVRTSDEATAAAADVVHDVLTDPRGWIRAGFRFVRDADAPYAVVIAEGPEVDELCEPYQTRSTYSCQNGPVVALNADRWRDATPQWPADVESYRTMLVNHEVGHLLHLHHPDPQCPGVGLPAPVMAQQSTELGECLPNPWPLEWEIDLAATRLEPLAPPADHDPADHRPSPPPASR